MAARGRLAAAAAHPTEPDVTNPLVPAASPPRGPRRWRAGRAFHPAGRFVF